MQKQRGINLKLQWKQLIVPAVALIGLYVLVPQFGEFRHSFTLLKHVDARGVLLALICVLLTYIAAASTYYCIALKRIPYWHTALVQVASMFINRLLPAGIGALGSNYAYLRRERHSSAQAGAVVAVNNALGLSGHIIVVTLAVLFYHDKLPPLSFSHGDGTTAWIIGLIVVLVVSVALSVPTWRGHASRALSSFATQLLRFRERPLGLLGGQLSSIGLTLSNVLSLYFCVLAVHGSASFVMVLLVFTLGVGLGTATPTPGGLGGFEAGLVAGFVAFDVSSAQALAIALLYRLLSYWLAIVIGSVAFVYAQRHHVFSPN